ncbi:hypothetical protein BC629DRAFT_1590343 [Irpex lacteus]|nr:hypothetical protein BC629DRAFT_1590343 [Irpex lacteus]
MAPKPRPIQRKLSSAANIGTPPNLPKTQNAQSMPPPPVPAAAAVPPGILMPEAVALNNCLKTATIKTGQILRFYNDTQKLRIHRHAPYPPRAVTASLGRELEKYDQLCDAMQTQLDRAIKVLQRDLEREKNRIKAEEEAKAAEAAKAAAAAAPPPFSPATESSEPLSAVSSKAPSSLTGRRQSTISLSSLQRPAFPHKLDLSATALRLNPEDMSMPSGLASPVMLAPKTSIPQLAPDFPFGPPGDVTIDLTMDDDVSVGMPPPSVPNGMDASLGTTADKPIELLDIDMELFGGADGSENIPSSGGASNPAASGSNGPVPVKEEAMDFSLFGDIPNAPPTSEDAAKVSEELLASLTASHVTAVTAGAADAAPQSSTNLLDSDSSPESFLAGLTAVSGSTNAQDPQHASSDDAANFNLDFLKEDGSMDVQALLGMNSVEEGVQNASNAGTQ